MKGNQITYSKRVIEIADWIFANPGKKISDEIAVFCSKFQKTERTIWDDIKKAHEYNKSRIEKQEKAKDEVLVEKAKESIKRDILSREKAEEILSKIAKGTSRPIVKRFKIDDNGSFIKDSKGDLIPTDYDIKTPTDADRINAINKLSQMNGWDAPIKNENTDTIRIGYE